MMLMRDGKDAAALACFDRVAALAPTLMEARRYRAILLARAGKLAAAAEDINGCLFARPEEGAGYYAAACVAALAAGHYGDAAAARQATEQALALLEKALARGYGADRAAADPDLKAVRGQPRFAELLDRFAKR
jgi:hypothetical protein